jgi:hypothetical protein
MFDYIRGMNLRKRKASDIDFKNMKAYIRNRQDICYSRLREHTSKPGKINSILGEHLSG